MITVFLYYEYLSCYNLSNEKIRNLNGLIQVEKSEIKEEYNDKGCNC